MYPHSHGFFGGAPIDDVSGATGSEASVTALGIDMAFTRRDAEASPTQAPGNFDLRLLFEKATARIRGGIVCDHSHTRSKVRASAPPAAIGGGPTGCRHGRGRGPAGRTILSRFDSESCTDCRRRGGRHTGLLQEEAQEEEEEEVRHEVTGLQCFDSGRGDH